MKGLLVLLLGIMPLCAIAQNFNEDGDKYEVYCEVFHSTWGNSLSFTINNKGYVVVDKNGERIKPEGVTEILNLLSKRGWKLVSSSISDRSNGTLYIYIMKKEITDDKEIEVGIAPQKKK